MFTEKKSIGALLAAHAAVILPRSSAWYRQSSSPHCIPTVEYEIKWFVSAAFAATAPTAVKLPIESSLHCTMSAHSAPPDPYSRYSSTNTMFVKPVYVVPHVAFRFVIVPYFAWHHTRNAASDSGSYPSCKPLHNPRYPDSFPMIHPTIAFESLYRPHTFENHSAYCARACGCS